MIIALASTSDPHRLPLGTQATLANARKSSHHKSKPIQIEREDTTRLEASSLLTELDSPDRANGTIMSTLPDSDPALTDQAHVAELATAKLKRQQQRILDTDAALVITKTTKPARKSKTEWKPFHLIIESDEEDPPSTLPLGTLADANSRLPTPFDVHAKPFTPTTMNSRESSSSRASVLGQSVVPSFLLDNDDGPEFQLVTSRKMRPPPSKPALHLNAYESKPIERTQTVAATFSKKEINEVFGNDLPPPEFVQGNPGFKNGQVQFVVHPNGDVAAQEWSSDKYQWTSIGQFSNIRRRREGLLAASRLRGETEQQSLMQNTLHYFRAVAKQHEALQMGLPWGTKEVNAVLPGSRVESSIKAENVNTAKTTATAPTGPTYTVASRFPLKPIPQAPRLHAIGSLSRDNVQPFPDFTPPGPKPASMSLNPLTISTFSRDHEMSTLENTPYSFSHETTDHSARSIPPFVRGDTQPSLDSMSFGSFPAVALYSGIQSGVQSGMQSGMQSGAQSGMQSDMHSGTESGVQNGGVTDQTFEQLMPVHSTGNLAFAPSNNTIGSAYSAWPTVPQTPENSSSSNYWPTWFDHESDDSDDLSPAPRPAKAPPGLEHGSALTTPFPSLDRGFKTSDRSAVKDYLNRLGETASARSMGSAPYGRTVLRDPMQYPDTSPAEQSPLRNLPLRRAGLSMPPDSRSEMDLGGFHTDDESPVMSATAAAEARRNLRVVSEPDPGPWNTKRLDDAEMDAWGTLASDQLKLYSKPTPQNWNGPFFCGDPTDQAVDQKSKDEELHNWFTGGNKRARQDEYFERIKAAHNATAPRRRSPGPIGPPRPNDPKIHETADFNEDTTRLLIPVLENLASYVEGPIEKRHGPFARYVPPPEWCVDRGPNGNKSFFGEDWGQAPERIGRDIRYRPMPFENRYGGSEQQPPIGTLVGLGRSVKPLDGRFKFPARQW